MNFKANMMLFSSTILLLISLNLLIKSIFISLEIPIISITYTHFQMSIIMDWISILFMSTVLFISSMIIKFSTSYIPKAEHNMFLNLLLMFVLSMIILIMSDNIMFILLGWDGLGLSSYILVIYYQNHYSAGSGSITIISNRIGDILILLSIAMLFINLNWNFSFNEKFPLITLIYLMTAAMSKSAQFPFSAWLPAAMSAPTPISALVHSSTLVTAGIYLLIRIMNFKHTNSMLILMLISSLTTMYASISALLENDMKKIIALSTLSQMAMMMFAISLGAVNLAFFHLTTHALFKSLMFLCAGILIHNSSYQDTRYMGSMLKSFPLPMTILGISSMALMGLPFMSGFFSKDAIIESMMSQKLTSIISMMMVFSISLTSMYSIRMIILSSKMIMKSKPDLNLHSDNKMEIPIMVMSIFSIMTGLLMMWISNSNQIFIIPKMMKISILLSLILGMLIPISLKFNIKKYTKLGESAISLWFIHFMTSYNILLVNPLMNKLSQNDKLWQEMYGPMKINQLLYQYSKLPYTFMLTMMFMLMMMFITPITFMM